MNEYNTESATGQLRNDPDELLQAGRVGDWAFDETTAGLIFICIVLPNGTPEGSFVRLPLTPIDSVQNWWEWDGNREAPTISPSINNMPHWKSAGWHGFMRAGKLESC